MKRILFVVAIIGAISLASSCKKCNSCTGANINTLNHDYCSDIYRSAKTMDEAKANCEIRGGTWAEK